ncbi:MAG: hypothetical protein K2O18_08380 [Oscillospiraceae bacterium]|nr:hypothetical protein [Oscillospiraceae bacterium]
MGTLRTAIKILPFQKQGAGKIPSFLDDKFQFFELIRLKYSAKPTNIQPPLQGLHHRQNTSKQEVSFQSAQKKSRQQKLSASGFTDVQSSSIPHKERHGVKICVSENRQSQGKAL